MGAQNLRIAPVTSDTWDDFASLLGPKGGSGGCWCTVWRLKRKEFEALDGDARKGLIKARVCEETPPGILAYDDDTPVGWCSIAPRHEFVRLATSRILKPVDDTPVWSISCFYIAKSHRMQGVSIALLEASAAFVAAQGGSVIEGYPIEPDRPKYPPVFAWNGLASAFRAAGFVEVARRSPTRPIMRKHLD